MQDKAKPAPPPKRHLHVPISEELLQQINVTATTRSLSVKDFVTETMSAACGNQRKKKGS